MSHDLIVAVFPSRGALTKALEHLTSLHELDIKRAAVLTKATTGDLVYVGDDIGPEEGGVAGGAFGAALAALGMVQLGALMLTGVGAILAIGAGALVGGLIGSATGRFAANLMDSGFEKTQIDLLTERLQTGHSALVLELANSRDMIDRMRQELAAYQAEMVERLPATSGA